MKWRLAQWPWLVAYAACCALEFFATWGKEICEAKLKAAPPADGGAS